LRLLETGLLGADYDALPPPGSVRELVERRLRDLPQGVLALTEGLRGAGARWIRLFSLTWLTSI
jgi:hypothetical protein